MSSWKQWVKAIFFGGGGGRIKWDLLVGIPTIKRWHFTLHCIALNGRRLSTLSKPSSTGDSSFAALLFCRFLVFFTVQNYFSRHFIYNSMRWRDFFFFFGEGVNLKEDQNRKCGISAHPHFCWTSMKVIDCNPAFYAYISNARLRAPNRPRLPPCSHQSAECLLWKHRRGTSKQKTKKTQQNWSTSSGEGWNLLHSAAASSGLYAHDALLSTSSQRYGLWVSTRRTLARGDGW